MTPVPGGAERAPSPWPEALRRAGPSRAGRGLTLPAASGPRRLTSRTFPKAQRGVGESSEKSFYPPPPAQRPVLLFLLPQSKRDCPGPAVPPPGLRSPDGGPRRALGARCGRPQTTARQAQSVIPGGVKPAPSGL